MITKLRLKNFKSFEDVEIDFGSVTTLIGMNASGKSNVRDALRLLHGIGRGYTLAEAIGEKWNEGGFLEWKGIRGGTREMVYQGSGVNECKIEIEFQGIQMDVYDAPIPIPKSILASGSYGITIDFRGNSFSKPRLKSEYFIAHSDETDLGEYLFHTNPLNKVDDELSEDDVMVSINNLRSSLHFEATFRRNQPIISQLIKGINSRVSWAPSLLNILREMRFLDVIPDEMRKYAVSGHRILTDRGENLSSVLSTICEEEKNKEVLLEWIRELAPFEITDFEFFDDRQGKIQLGLIEASGRTISADSASDGTLRFLAMLAALLSPEPAKLYFFEEIENGIHPSRLHLLLQLMEQRSSQANMQIVLSTHSPQMLEYMSDESRRSANLVYRTSHASSSRVAPILSLPNIGELLKSQHVSELHASGWFENVMEFLEPDEVVVDGGVDVDGDADDVVDTDADTDGEG